MNRIAISLACLLLASSAFAGPKAKQPRKPPPATPRSVTLNPQYWQFWYSLVPHPTLPPPWYASHPVQLSGQPGWYFAVPYRSPSQTPEWCWANFTCPEVDYVLHPQLDPITASKIRIKVQVAVTGGSPLFGFMTEPGNTCSTPAHVRAIVWDKNFNDSEFGRWWSNPSAVQLSATTGIVTIDIPVSPEHWSSVYGKRGIDSPSALAGWQWAFTNPGKIGLTFGGGCFFGHGVYVTGGTADFRLLEYSLIP